MSKIIFCSDLHLGLETNGYILENGWNNRALESFACFEEVCTYIKNCNFSQDNKIDYLIICGDIFDVKMPSLKYQNKFKELIFDLSKHCKIVILLGNHDIISTKNNISVLDDIEIFNLKNIYLFKNNTIKELELSNGEKIKAASLTWDLKLDELDSFLNSAKEQNVNIVFGHLTVIGAKNSNFIFKEGVPLELLKKYNFRCMALGDIHKTQILSENPFIFYTGSLIPTDFGEENDIKGFYVYDTLVNEYSFHETNYTKLKTIRGDIEYILENINNNDYTNHYLKLVLNIYNKNAKTPNFHEILNGKCKQFIVEYNNIEEKVKKFNISSSFTFEEVADLCLKDNKEVLDLCKKIKNEYLETRA